MVIKKKSLNFHQYCGYLVVIRCGFSLHFLITKDAEHLFMFLLVTWLASFDKCLGKSFACILLSCFSFSYKLTGVFCIVIYKYIIGCMFCKYLLPPCGLPFHSLRPLLIKSKLSVFSFVVNVSCVPFR